jgi:hypothetical protein
MLVEVRAQATPGPWDGTQRQHDVELGIPPPLLQKQKLVV